MDPAPRPIDDETIPSGTASTGGPEAGSAHLQAMRRRLGDLRAADPQWRFGSAMNDMLGADAGPIRPPSAPEPVQEDDGPEASDAASDTASDTASDPLASVPEPEEAMRLVEDQAHRLRELAAEAMLEEGPYPSDEEDPRPAAASDLDADGPVAMPAMEFVTDAEQRYREHAEAAAEASSASEDLPEDELAAALESMLQPPATAGADGGEVSRDPEDREEPAAELDRTLERMIDEGQRTDLDPALESLSGVDDPGDGPVDGDDAAAEPADGPPSMMPRMEFVVHADDLPVEEPGDGDPAAEDPRSPALSPTSPPASRRAALKAVRGALAAKAATLDPVRKALGDDGWGDVDETSLSPAQLTSLMVNLDQTLADGVETLLESSYDAVADILDLVFEEVEPSDDEADSEDLLEESSADARASGRRREERARDPEAADATGRGDAASADPLDAAGEMAAVDDLDVDFDEVDLDEPGSGSAAPKSKSKSKAKAGGTARTKAPRISPPLPGGPGVLEMLLAKLRSFQGDWSGSARGMVRGTMAVLSRPLDHVPPDWRTTVDWVAISLAFWVPIVWLLVVFVL